ncbi:hypothetical protein [Alicyclobacillus mengziensis]|uniref:Uncharacterized protein n=1 Tax=Alicyclobacillus mengziensis TaxID=2931921 RepID=A0A9X7Z782_9BACL|nr:hypothetical protein [Alicyclobacillus mengziensis]QSO47146.1 hypothetical protein JZ786_22550 [Alicyclobacillus mengziensis]
MQLEMSADDVITRIKELSEQGDPLNKKRVKQSDPVLMKHALYYYPSWEHAVRETGLELN